jgi:hypothetical protein
MGFALMIGSGAFASETGAGTLQFLLSKPAAKSRFLLAKFAVRGTETAFIFIAPASIAFIKEGGLMVFATRLLNIIDPSIVAHPLLAAHWDVSLQWLWVPPYLMPQYFLLALLAIIFQFSGCFFFSVLIPKRALPALGGIVFCTAFFSLRGMALLQSAWESAQVKADILLLFLSTLGLLALSAVVFMVKEY